MSVNPVMTTLQMTALKELTKFTGDPSQKVTQFINAIEHIGTFSKMNDSMLHSLATIKLGGAAFNWYDNNKETLKERKQQSGETLLAYYDDVVDLRKRVDNEMPLHMIVDYLQDGLREELKIHVKRHMKTLTGELTPAIFLKIARNEDELQQEISSTPRGKQRTSRLRDFKTSKDFKRFLETSTTETSKFTKDCKRLR